MPEVQLTIHTEQGPVDVMAQTTLTPGLYVHRLDCGTWHLTCESGSAIGSFPTDTQAHEAAQHLGALDIADWTSSTRYIRATATTFVYDIHDAVHDAGGRFLYRAGGPGARALAARHG